MGAEEGLRARSSGTGSRELARPRVPAGLRHPAGPSPRRPRGAPTEREWPADRLREAQEARLPGLVLHAFARVPSHQVASRNPQARGAKPEDFVDTRLLKEIDDSGFIDRLYR